ncbi:methanogen marker protein 4 [Methanohalobium evestigatum Z-7303]|uniref:Methanogen marker protein 4 n=1 Tax=Methanohalobium evestigatum (strain ATCC BAA-1072 / DSM 3721 / NBRC 107634 / OCM 161 / Z-7303) TaxID=644295 RepID=D7E9H3_METEZ|nr:methanogenesis marker protein Mmp4/MtxX [Methanohalobium evestigatum]ADI74245.1 methanogen marker protein 4 [Methanohalobium evestigatum Z-7303]
MMFNDSSILNIVEKKAIENKARVAIGINFLSTEILDSLKKAQDRGYANIVIVGCKKDIENLDSESNIEIVDTDNPEKSICELLASNDVDAAVRGNIKASKVLDYLKTLMDAEKLYRIALLQTNMGRPFFFAPVGIDEGNDLASKIEHVKKSIEHIRRFDIDPEVGILSGGRSGDIGRNNKVDRTLADAEFITRYLLGNGINATNHNILIENAVKESDFVYAPDGITGNLIFRTLVYLCGGEGIGAPVLTDEYVFVDTSRARKDFTKAIMIASALTSIKTK